MDENNKIIKLNQYPAYQDGTIISNALIRKKEGNVTLFAFAEGQSLSEHTAPFDALVNIIEGEMRITIGGQEHHLNDNEMIIMPANVSHALFAKKNSRMLLVMIKAN